MPISDNTRNKIINAVAMALPKPIIVEMAAEEGVDEDTIDSIVRQYDPDIKEIRSNALRNAGLDAVFNDDAVLVKTARFADLLEVAVIRSFKDNPVKFHVVAKNLIPLWNELVDRIRSTGGDEVSETLEAKLIIERVRKTPAKDRDEIQRALMDARDKIADGNVEEAREIVRG